MYQNYVMRSGKMSLGSLKAQTFKSPRQNRKLEAQEKKFCDTNN